VNGRPLQGETAAPDDSTVGNAADSHATNADGRCAYTRALIEEVVLGLLGTCPRPSCSGPRTEPRQVPSTHPTGTRESDDALRESCIATANHLKDAGLWSEVCAQVLNDILAGRAGRAGGGRQ
jgi:hypothetical protein